MEIDHETGWSKGFGFVSFSQVFEADAAMAAVHNSSVAGRRTCLAAAAKFGEVTPERGGRHATTHLGGEAGRSRRAQPEGHAPGCS